ncbi:hypothetical protein SADUNF_Sadunf17G0122100 [Salix dunnii]|uniref:Uncharacterized protein n=1 Tax=Salix dunnii TaxID=1413687 RepID=A0A835J645_9ROSI|nr:hypothetical protein SADUNF_Sadunf17G0122100 [Salix dunnii]
MNPIEFGPKRAHTVYEQTYSQQLEEAFVASTWGLEHQSYSQQSWVLFFPDQLRTEKVFVGWIQSRGFRRTKLQHVLDVVKKKKVLRSSRPVVWTGFFLVSINQFPPDMA